jgi:hypothetical protein
VTASLGIWAEGALPRGMVYRWEADHGEGGSGFVAFDPDTRQIRPSDASGNVLGSMIINGADGEVSGSADGIDPVVLTKVAGSILRAFKRSGEAPVTAHAHFY